MQYAPVAQVAERLSLRQPRSVRCQQQLVSGALLGLLDSIHAQIVLYSWWVSVNACGKSDDFGHAHHCTWPCGLMDKALVFGTKDCRFESCQGHFSRFANPSCSFNWKSRSFVSRFANPSCSPHRKQSLLLHLCYLGKSIKKLKSQTSTVQQKYITVLQSR